MQLLVSVRSEAEVAAALSGGADIVDAKEPALGSLGPVDAEVLAAIAARVPESVPLSIALGDFREADAARAAILAAISAVATNGHAAPHYLKLGFAGRRAASGVTAVLAAARRAAGTGARSPIIVPVAYADHDAAGAPSPEVVLQAAVAAGAGALLVDTWSKDGRGLLDHLPLDRLARLSDRVRGAGLLFAVAGSLDLASVGRVAGLADVIGVRGAACTGGRMGAVDGGRVRELRHRLGAGRPMLSSA